jgi:hypothetical protein
LEQIPGEVRVLSLLVNSQHHFTAAMAESSEQLFDRLGVPSYDGNSLKYRGVCSLLELAASTGEAHNETAFRLCDLIADENVGHKLLDVLQWAPFVDDELRAIAASQLALALEFGLNTNEEATILMLASNPNWLKHASFFDNLKDENIKVTHPVLCCPLDTLNIWH